MGRKSLSFHVLSINRSVSTILAITNRSVVEGEGALAEGDDTTKARAPPMDREAMKARATKQAQNKKGTVSSCSLSHRVLVFCRRNSQKHWPFESENRLNRFGKRSYRSIVVLDLQKEHFVSKSVKLLLLYCFILGKELVIRTVPTIHTYTPWTRRTTRFSRQSCDDAKFGGILKFRIFIALLEFGCQRIGVSCHPEVAVDKERINRCCCCSILWRKAIFFHLTAG